MNYIGITPTRCLSATVSGRKHRDTQGCLRCELVIKETPPSLKAGITVHVTARATNAGDTIWNATPSRLGGFVTLGCKLLTPGRRLQTDALGRTFLPTDVHPGETIELKAAVTVPFGTPPGEYRLAFDFVNELVCWFADVSSNPPTERTVLIIT